MGKGRRYDAEGKLNMKKVLAVVIAIAVIIMFIVGLSNLLKSDKNSEEKVIAINYFSVYTNGKWGVINSNGSTIIEPTYSELIQIPDKTKDVFICTDINYSDNSYTSKAVNKKNEEIFSKYEMVETIQNNDIDNNLWYENNILKVKKDGKYGVIDLNGKEIVPCEYEKIEALRGVTNSLVTTKNSKLGLIDNSGSIIIENKYQEIDALTDRYEDGFIVKDENGKYGVINYNKKTALECKYDQIENIFGNDTYVVKEDGTLKVVSADGDSYLEGKYSEIKDINGENVIVKSEEKYGVVTLSGEELIPAEYDDLTYTFSNYYIAKKNDKFGVINTAKEKVIDFNYTSLVYRKAADFIEGAKNKENSDLIDRNMEVKVTGIVSEVNIDKGYIKVRVNNEYKYYNFKFEEKALKEILKTNTLFVKKENGKYGYVNKEGTVVVNFEYDDATEQNEYGYAAVKKNGLWGAIDQKGNVIIEPKYSLDNNAIITFLGKWHIAEDLNANYYTDK